MVIFAFVLMVLYLVILVVCLELDPHLDKITKNGRTIVLLWYSTKEDKRNYIKIYDSTWKSCN
jgi:hypothetical protein